MKFKLLLNRDQNKKFKHFAKYGEGGAYFAAERNVKMKASQSGAEKWKFLVFKNFLRPSASTGTNDAEQDMRKRIRNNARVSE